MLLYRARGYFFRLISQLEDIQIRTIRLKNSQKRNWRIKILQIKCRIKKLSISARSRDLHVLTVAGVLQEIRIQVLDMVKRRSRKKKGGSFYMQNQARSAECLLAIQEETVSPPGLLFSSLLFRMGVSFFYSLTLDILLSIIHFLVANNGGNFSYFFIGKVPKNCLDGLS